jgi:hypothetical protein
MSQVNSKAQDELVKEMEKFVLGGVAGMVSKSAVAPLERIRILAQTGENGNFVDIGKKVFRSNGIKGFFRGNGVNIYRTL